MRGKAYEMYRRYRSEWITPAYAGKSCRYTIIFTVDKDHPRLCGEKNDIRETSVPFDRITPAYAGKSIVTTR